MKSVTRVQNSPAAYGFLAGMLVLLLGLIANASCAHASKLDMLYAQADDQYDRVVSVRVMCVQDNGQIVRWTGSGVIVDATRILTAGHVAEHEKNATCTYLAEDASGQKYLMRPIKVMDSDHIDLASMELISPAAKFKVKSVHFGERPRVGEVVCTVTGHPRLERKCGPTMRDKDPPGDIRLDMIVEPGNSGSGLYDSSGALVGIVVHLYFCSNGQYCSGAATSLEGRIKDLLP